MRYGYGFSQAKILYLSRLILDKFNEDDGVELFADDNQLIKAIKTGIEDEVKFYDELRQKAEQKILSQKREIHEGNREWELLISKYFTEELDKLDKVSRAPVLTASFS